MEDFMSYNILTGLVIVVLGLFVLFNYRKLVVSESELQKDTPKDDQPPKLITDTVGHIETVQEEKNIKELKARKPSAKKASKKISKKVSKRKPPRREL